MSFHGGFLGCVAAVMLFSPPEQASDPVARRYHHGGRTDRAVSRTHRQFHQQRVVGRPADASVPWRMVFPNGGPLPRHPSQLYEARLEGIVLFTILACDMLGARKGRA